MTAFGKKLHPHSLQESFLSIWETTYADAGGIQVLRAIYSQTEAAILTSTPWTQYLADEVTRKNENQSAPEA